MLKAIDRMLFIVVICVPHSVLGQTAMSNNAYKGRVSLKDIQADSRLNIPVTFSERQITLRSLCKQITDKTNIKINAEDRFGTADELVAVFCKDLPVYKLMNALWSNFSNRNYQWFWEIDGKGVKRSYKLVQTTPAVKYRSQLHDYFQTTLEENTRSLMAAVEGTDEEKRAAMTSAFGSDTLETFKGLGFNVEKLWADVQALRDGVPKDELADLLTGNEGTVIPFDRLKPSTINYYTKARLDWLKFSGDNSSDVPMPTQIIIEKDHQMGIPRLSFILPGIGFNSFSTGPGPNVTINFAKQMAVEYVLDVDESTMPSESNNMAIPTYSPLMYKTEMQAVPAELDGLGLQPHLATIPLFTPRNQYTVSFQQLAEGEAVPLVVWLQEDDDKIRPLGKIKGQTFNTYKERNKLTWMLFKWHDGVQCSRFAFMPLEDMPLEEKTIAKLRKSAVPGEFLPLEAIVNISNAATIDQLVRLGTEFPALLNVRSGLLALKLIKAMPELISESTNRKRLPINDRLSNIISSSFPRKILKTFNGTEPAYIQVFVRGSMLSAASVAVNLFDSEGKPMTALAFVNAKQPKPKVESK